MNKVCPLCGRKTDDGTFIGEYADDPVVIKNQIQNLDRFLNSILLEDSSILSLVENREEMCPLCFKILDRINSVSDRETLVDRLNSTVEKLEEMSEQKETGFA